jgi:hypothetical protein
MGLRHQQFTMESSEIIPIRDLSMNDAALMARGIQNSYDAVRRALREGNLDDAYRHMRDSAKSRLELEGWIRLNLGHGYLDHSIQSQT